MTRATTLSLCAGVVLFGTQLTHARDYISIVGSSTVYPFATVVAEQFGKSSRFKTPKIESTGSGGGLKLFCAGIGVAHPDITNASRRIKQSEIDLCARNGVQDIIEIQIGFDGIVIGGSKRGPKLQLSRLQIFMALAKQVPAGDGAGQLVDNPNRTWADVHTELPPIRIEVLGPPPTSGTRDAFAELALEGGCKQIDWLSAMQKQDKYRFKTVCHTLREDGAYIEVGENDNLIVQKLEANPNAFGVFGFSFLDQNSDKIKGALVDGVAPTFENISSGAYPVSRPLYFYVKKAHVGAIPGLAGYLAEFTSDKAAGEEGYLTDRGLIPLPDNAREAFARAARDLTPMKL